MKSPDQQENENLLDLGWRLRFLILPKDLPFYYVIMKKPVLIFSFLFLSTFGFAFDKPSDSLQGANAQWKQHCQEIAADPQAILKKLNNLQNRLSFRNHGGLFNGGVCWWHSRLTRIAQYLAVFNPNEKPLSAEEVYAQVKRLRQGKPAVFNGFKNFYELSYLHSSEIQKNLEEWQIANGGFQLGFLDGLRGSTFVPADELRSLMDETFELFQSSQKPIYQVLQLPGVTAHAWLISNMITTSNGYQFSVVDSNYFEIQNWNYRYGDTGFFYSGSPFIAYTTRRGVDEEVALTKRLNEVCNATKKRVHILDISNSWPDLDTELDVLETRRGAPSK